MRGILSATIVALAACSGLAQSDNILREGSGDRRAALDAMELTPFNKSSLGLLVDWIGQPVEADDVDGKPVLILTWASWHSGSTASARAAELMAKSFGDQGLVVVGVHSDEGFDTAAQSAERLRLSFPVARDAGSKFRESLKVDMDPNFYVIDRAGQIRFADIERSSVREAVKVVTEETREQAEGAAGRRSAAGEPASRLIASVSEGDVAQIPEWDIPPQDALAYQDAKWPDRWPEYEEAVQADFGRRGRNELPIVNFDTELVTWLKPKPPMAGRVRVVYFWAPNVNESYARVQPVMDDLQRRYGRDIAVIGAAVPAITVDSRDPSAVDREIERFANSLTSTLTRSNIKHTIAFDRQWELLTSSLGKESYGDQMGRELASGFAFPLAAIYSTDNTVRWIGSPLSDKFRVALNRILDVDPAVKLRRTRDEAYLARQNRR